jgi:protein-tyrosine phosphatase
LVKLLFVYTGNICRSPTAHGLMRARIESAGLTERIQCDSAGTHGYHQGEPPDRRSIATARQFGIEIDDLRARKAVPADLDEFDIIAVMEEAHRRHLLGLRSAPPRAEIRLLPSFFGLENEVPDPYYDDKSFLSVYRLIERGVDAMFAEVCHRFKLSPSDPAQ